MAKSEKQKKLEGTDRADRRRKPIEFSDEWPEPREYIQDVPEAMEAFGLICKLLADYRLLEKSDSMAISKAAFNLYLMEDSAQRLKDGEMIQTFQNGTQNLSPLFSVWEKTSSAFDKDAKALGLNTWARNNLREMFVKPEIKDEAKDRALQVISKVSNG